MSFVVSFFNCFLNLFKVITDWFEEHRERLKNYKLGLIANLDESMVSPGARKKAWKGK